MKRLPLYIRFVCIMIGLIAVIGCESKVQVNTDVEAFVNDFLKLENYYKSRVEAESWNRLNLQETDSLDYYKRKLDTFLSDARQLEAAARLIRIEKDEILKEKLLHIHRTCLLTTIEVSPDVGRVRDSLITVVPLSSSPGPGSAFNQSLSRLARVRNQAASRLGYNSYFDLLLYSEGISREEYFDLIEMVEDATGSRFKRIVDSVSNVQGNASITIDELYRLFGADASRVGLSAETANYLSLIKETLGGLGFNFEAMPIYLSEAISHRPGELPQLMAIDIPNDVRIILNSTANSFVMSDMFHYVGRSIYLINIDQRDQFYRRPPSIGFELGMSQMMGRLVELKDWKRKYAGLPEPKVLSESVGQEFYNLLHLRSELIYSRFQFELYNDPFADLKETYCRLFEEYTGLSCSSTLDIRQDNMNYIVRPLHNYDVLVGEVIAAQIYHYIDTKYGSVLDNPRTREFLVQNMYRHGARDSWTDLIERGTGEKLRGDYLLSAFRD